VNGAALAGALLVASAGALLFFDLGVPGITAGDEAYYHGAARHMARTGEWGRIVFAGENRVYDTFTHAPLFFWAKGLVLLVLEDSRFSMRVLSAAFGVVSVATTAWLGRRLAGDAAGLFAGLVQLTTFQFVWVHGARSGVMEPLLLALLAAIAILFLRAIEDGKSFWPHHVCLALLVGLKLGLVVAPVLAETAFFLATPRARRHFRDWLTLGAAIAPVGLSWHVVQAALQWDGFVETATAVIQQTAGTGSAALRLGLLGNLDYYASVLAWGAFPHSLVLPIAILSIARPPARSLAAGWRVVVFQALALLVFFTVVSAHYTWYAMPLLPFLSVAIGAWWAQLAGARQPIGVLLALALALGVGAWAEPWTLEADPFLTKPAVVQRPVWGELALRGIAGLPGWACALATSVVASVGLLALRGRPRVLASAVVALLLGSAAARVVAPLRFRQTVSASERIHEDLERRRASGQPVSFPIPLFECDRWMTPYLFAEHYAVEPLARASTSEPCARIVGVKP
jgi:4-amino-4-deoxy-L-arabinose transferase-like glycosyltransferase